MKIHSRNSDGSMRPVWVAEERGRILIRQRVGEEGGQGGQRLNLSPTDARHLATELMKVCSTKEEPE